MRIEALAAGWAILSVSVTGYGIDLGQGESFLTGTQCAQKIQIDSFRIICAFPKHTY